MKLIFSVNTQQIERTSFIEYYKHNHIDNIQGCKIYGYDGNWVYVPSDKLQKEIVELDNNTLKELLSSDILCYLENNIGRIYFKHYHSPGISSKQSKLAQTIFKNIRYEVKNNLYGIYPHKKKIFITEHHHHSLIPWDIIKRKEQRELILITFDHHSDTHPCKLNEWTNKKQLQTYDRKWAKNEISNTCLEDIVNLLINDEQLDTATLKGIVKEVYSFNHLNHKNENVSDLCNVFNIGYIDYIQSDDARDNFKNEFEELMLDERLKRLNIFNKGLYVNNRVTTPYILDFDLDVFHFKETLQPKKSKILQNLISDAVAITITKECSCYDNLKKTTNDLSCEEALKKLFKFIVNNT